MRVDEKIGKAIDCQEEEAKRNYRGFVTVVISIIIIVLLLVLCGRVGVYTCFCIACYCNNCLKFMLRCCIMSHPRCVDCAFSASFVKECADVSFVAGEGVGLTLHKESVVIDEIKEVELRFRRAQFMS